MSNPKSEKIAAVVVTFNRKILLGECLDALLNQTHPLDTIIIIDNASTDGTEEFLKQKYLCNSIFDYVRLPENTGGAGGFYEGVKRGHEQGFDWLWLMDDDSEPKENALEVLVHHLSLNPHILVLRSLAVDKTIGNVSWKQVTYDESGRKGVIFRDNTEVYKMNPRIYRILGFSFIGVLIHKRIIDKISYPLKELFIWCDDAEYSYRIRSAGYELFLHTGSLIYHPSCLQISILGLKVGLLRGNPQKLYYGIRNIIWVYKKYDAKKFWLKKFPITLFNILYSLIKDENRLERMRMYTLGIYHGFRGKLGKLS